MKMGVQSVHNDEGGEGRHRDQVNAQIIYIEALPFNHVKRCENSVSMLFICTPTHYFLLYP